MNSAGVSIIPEFMEKVEALELEERFDITKGEVVNNVSNSSILFSGIKTSSGDQTAKLKSLQGITTWILDEAEELTDEETFDKIDLSVRQKGAHNRVIMVMNPATKEHWIYQRFFEDRGIEPGFNGISDDVCYIHTTYLDNIQNLDESYLAQIENIKRRRPEKYKYQILGGWRNRAEGVVFENWSIGDFPNVNPTYGMDFGFSVDPTTLVAIHIDKKHNRIFLKELLCRPNLTTSDIYNIVNPLVGSKLIIADSAEPRLIAELKSRGLNIKGAAKGKDSITGGIAQMQDYDLIVDKSSTNLIKELNNYAWLDKGNKPIDGWNHNIDASRYAISYQLDNPTRGSYSII